MTTTTTMEQQSLEEDDNDVEEEEGSEQGDWTPSTSGSSDDDLMDDDDDDDDDDDFDAGGLLGGMARNSNKAAAVPNDAANVADKLFHWRVAFLAMLVCSGVLLSTGTYYVLRYLEERDCTAQYYDLTAMLIQENLNFQMINLHSSMRALALTVTSFATTQQLSFPFVTVSMFETHARQALERSRTTAVLYTPIVSGVYQEDWEAYAGQAAPLQLEESRSIANALDGESGDSGTAVVAGPEGGDGVISSFAQKTTKETTNSDVVTRLNTDDQPFPYIYSFNSSGNGPPERIPTTKAAPCVPFWQKSPAPPNAYFINYNVKELDPLRSAYRAVRHVQEGLMTPVARQTTFLISPPRYPNSYWVEPVFASMSSATTDADNETSAGVVVGYLAATVPWHDQLANMGGIPPQSLSEMTFVLSNTCGQSYAYRIDGETGRVIFLGEESTVEYGRHLPVEIPLLSFYHPEVLQNVSDDGSYCNYSFVVTTSNDCKAHGRHHYTLDMENPDMTFWWTLSVGVVFLILSMTFTLYDCFARREHSIVVRASQRANNIISSLFPTNVRDRLLAEPDHDEPDANASKKQSRITRLEKLFSDAAGAGGDHHGEAGGDLEMDEDNMYKSKPIADLFPETTILFADIAGFTAWSSEREPTQVFTLLETVYHRFDSLAKRRRVFKVETVGDCYVAVAGLPNPRKDHAVAMARFARDCMVAMWELTKKLEVTLGPETGDLEMRMGLHSGPVTAGVLRGDRSRFQLFGDTMNTASRMESTGDRGRIQMSQDTTDLLIAAGKSNWISLRESLVVAKGKGEMQTYWLSLPEAHTYLDPSNSGDAAHQHQHQHSIHHSARGEGAANASGDQGAHDGLLAENDVVSKSVLKINSAKISRLIEWNVDVMLRLIKQVVARRVALDREFPWRKPDADENQFTRATHRVLDEVKEVIDLPTFKCSEALSESASVTLDPLVVDQVYDFVSNIAAMYRNNPFHNFEHASHVTMSVTKLLSRIVSGDEVGPDGTPLDHSLGINNDPLTQFSCVLAALIHDVDHPGVPNAQLIKEKTHIAEFYRGKSIAEQNSVDLAWHLLMDDSYGELRKTLYTTNNGIQRFRQLLVNAVMATDIVDKELKALRNARWEKAFSMQEDTLENVNRKATIVIEHLLQASDVAHTMQHWHIYRKWNERFFMECYKAYREGRAETDPTEGWYKGEIGFFDFYIIPLAKKLKDCGVFGVSSDEYLNYAVKNRKEWEAKGQEVVSEMIEKVNQMEWPGDEKDKADADESKPPAPLGPPKTIPESAPEQPLKKPEQPKLSPKAERSMQQIDSQQRAKAPTVPNLDDEENASGSKHDNSESSLQMEKMSFMTNHMKGPKLPAEAKALLDASSNHLKYNASNTSKKTSPGPVDVPRSIETTMPASTPAKKQPSRAQPTPLNGEVKTAQPPSDEMAQMMQLQAAMRGVNQQTTPTAPKTSSQPPVPQAKDEPSDSEEDFSSDESEETSSEEEDEELMHVAAAPPPKRAQAQQQPSGPTSEMAQMMQLQAAMKAASGGGMKQAPVTPAAAAVERALHLQAAGVTAVPAASKPKAPAIASSPAAPTNEMAQMMQLQAAMKAVGSSPSNSSRASSVHAANKLNASTSRQPQGAPKPPPASNEMAQMMQIQAAMKAVGSSPSNSSRASSGHSGKTPSAAVAKPPQAAPKPPASNEMAQMMQLQAAMKAVNNSSSTGRTTAASTASNSPARKPAATPPRPMTAAAAPANDEMAQMMQMQAAMRAVNKQPRSQARHPEAEDDSDEDSSEFDEDESSEEFSSAGEDEQPPSLRGKRTTGAKAAPQQQTRQAAPAPANAERAQMMQIQAAMRSVNGSKQPGPKHATPPPPANNEMAQMVQLQAAMRSVNGTKQAPMAAAPTPAHSASPPANNEMAQMMHLQAAMRSVNKPAPPPAAKPKPAPVPAAHAGSEMAQMMQLQAAMKSANNTVPRATTPARPNKVPSPSTIKNGLAAPLTVAQRQQQLQKAHAAAAAKSPPRVSAKPPTKTPSRVTPPSSASKSRTPPQPKAAKSPGSAPVDGPPAFFL